MNYYNEFDPSAAAWLRELIAQGLIPAGEVDERSITEIKPDELSKYTQCHFFAGIGGWSLALELADWDPARPVWTGSCPCQPFSAAGKQLAQADERHLWPVFFDLIRECRPVTVFGEQVADAISKGWLDGISADLEGEGYACGAVVLGAHSVGAPYIRKRLYWVADASGLPRAQHVGEPGNESGRPKGPHDPAERRGDTCGLAESRRVGSTAGLSGPEARQEGDTGKPDNCGDQLPRRMADAPSGGLGILGDETQPGSGGHADGAGEPHGLGIPNGDGRQPGDESAPASRHGHPVEPAGFWDDSRWIYCRDGKHRRIPTQPALFPLADGLPYKLARRGSIRPALLKGSGNAIVPEIAAEFIQAFIAP